jgi:hypothetical protein
VNPTIDYKGSVKIDGWSYPIRPHSDNCNQLKMFWVDKIYTLVVSRPEYMPCFHIQWSRSIGDGSARPQRGAAHEMGGGGALFAFQNKGSNP